MDVGERRILKKHIFLKILLTIFSLKLFFHIFIKLEYMDQLTKIDNLIGVLPLILFSGFTIFNILLIWNLHKGVNTITIVLGMLTLFWGFLFIPSISGNWYPLAGSITYGSAAPDLKKYAPFSEYSKAAKLSKQASINLKESLPKLDGAIALYPLYSAFSQAVYDTEHFTEDTVTCSNTRQAYDKIIEGKCDIIFVAGPSETQLRKAKAAGVELVFTPIGREAFVFLKGYTNPIKNITHQEVKNIYSGKTAKWNTLGWPEGGNIIAYQRPEGSGSQTGLQKIMNGVPIQKPQPLPDNDLFGTGSMLQQVSVFWEGVQSAISFSYRYYAERMYPNSKSKLLAIDKIYPNNETIVSGEYPYSADFYAVTKKNATRNTKKIVNWMQTPEGQELVEKTGYVKKFK